MELEHNLRSIKVNASFKILCSLHGALPLLMSKWIVFNNVLKELCFVASYGGMQNSIFRSFSRAFHQTLLLLLLLFTYIAHLY